MPKPYEPWEDVCVPPCKLWYRELMNTMAIQRKEGPELVLLQPKMLGDHPDLGVFALG
jgi:hypothetical protein